MSGSPLGFLDSSGARADATLPLMWFLILLSGAVCLVVGYLLWRAAGRGSPLSGNLSPVIRREGGNRLVFLGLAITAPFLLVALGWTMVAIAQIAPVPRRPEVEIDVTAHQWWWQADYDGATPGERFTTANEIHIPVGAPVLIRLHSNDVIHSFWVPKLSGKTDLIPGQVNLAWMEARLPGIYRGQCSEFCGLEHAKMAFHVVADRPSDYDEWRRAQLQTAPPPVTNEQAEGLALVENKCAECHAVRGTRATSRVAPELTHLMSRRYIAAGTLPNNPSSLAGWIEDPQSAKPGVRMPAQHLSGPQLQAILAYLGTLK